MKIRKPCRQVLCNNLAEIGSAYCAKHKPQQELYHKYDNMYANARWRALRKRLLIERVECAVCGYEASEVDHIRPHRGDLELFFDEKNLQVLCKSCHSKKTAKEVNTRKSTQKR